MNLNSEGLDVDKVVIACCECTVLEIRLIGPTIVSNEDRSWGVIKALH